MAVGIKTGGRRPGSVNKITTAFKDAVRLVFEDIGGRQAFAAWARENPTEFYRIAARLIPAEVAGSHQSASPLVVVVDRLGENRRAVENGDVGGGMVIEHRPSPT